MLPPAAFPPSTTMNGILTLIIVTLQPVVVPVMMMPWVRVTSLIRRDLVVLSQIASTAVWAFTKRGEEEDGEQRRATINNNIDRRKM